MQDLTFITPTLNSGVAIANITGRSGDATLYAPTGPTLVSELTNDEGYITSAATTGLLDSAVLYADITGTDSALTSNVAFAAITAATPTKVVMLRRDGDIYQLAKATTSGLEFRVSKRLEIDEIVMTSSTITYNAYITAVDGATLTINS